MHSNILLYDASFALSSESLLLCLQLSPPGIPCHLIFQRIHIGSRQRAPWQFLPFHTISYCILFSAGEIRDLYLQQVLVRFFMLHKKMQINSSSSSLCRYSAEDTKGSHFQAVLRARATLMIQLKFQLSLILKILCLFSRHLRSWKTYPQNAHFG
jgi:hypothetical protein